MTEQSRLDDKNKKGIDVDYQIACKAAATRLVMGVEVNDGR
jgi:hypothetical protein